MLNIAGISNRRTTKRYWWSMELKVVFANTKRSLEETLNDMRQLH